MKIRNLKKRINCIKNYTNYIKKLKNIYLGVEL